MPTHSDDAVTRKKRGMDSDLARSAAASATDTTHVLIPDAEDPQ